MGATGAGVDQAASGPARLWLCRGLAYRGLMKKLKVAAGVLVGLVVLVVLGGYALDSHVELSTTGTLKAKPAAVFEQVNSYDGEVEWWTEAMKAYEGEDMPAMTIVHAGGPEQGTGMLINFMMGEQVGEEWTFLASEPGKIVIEVDFQMFVVERTLTFEPEGEGTKITWSETADIQNPVMRYFTVIMPPDEVIKNFDMAIVALDKVTAPV